MKRLTFVLLGAVGAFFILSPAQAADFRVIKWNVTKICQIYDMSWGFKPIPPDYKVLTKSISTYDGAVKAKTRLAKKGQCSV